MRRTLHIIRRPNDPLALEAIEQERSAHEVVVLLIQDGVLTTVRPSAETYVGTADAEARGVHPPFKQASYPEICRLIIEAQRVVVW
jgi:hypothetical protein